MNKAQLQLQATFPKLVLDHLTKWADSLKSATITVTGSYDEHFRLFMTSGVHEELERFVMELSNVELLLCGFEPEE